MPKPTSAKSLQSELIESDSEDEDEDNYDTKAVSSMQNSNKKPQTADVNDQIQKLPQLKAIIKPKILGIGTNVLDHHEVVSPSI
jgi:hypothetical protein